MSDNFKVGVFFGDTILRQGTAGALTYDELHEVCNNHNNHDRLTEENKQLREALKFLIEASEVNEEQLNDLLMRGDYGESQALCNARELLNK